MTTDSASAGSWRGHLLQGSLTVLLTIPSPIPPFNFARLRHPRVVAAKPKTDRHGETEAEILADLYRIGQRDQHTASTSTRPAERPSLLASGTAIPFNTSSTTAQFRGRRIVIDPRAFDESLAAVAAGRLRVPLLFDHESSRVLGGTRGGGIVVVASPSGVRLGVVNSAAGRSILDWLAANPPFHSLSGGYDPIRLRDTRDERGPIYVVEAAALREISIVCSPAFPGTGIVPKQSP